MIKSSLRSLSDYDDDLINRQQRSGGEVGEERGAGVLRGEDRGVARIKGQRPLHAECLVELRTTPCQASTDALREVKSLLGQECQGEAELIVSKHRNGPLDTVQLAYQGRYTRFANMAQGVA